MKIYKSKVGPELIIPVICLAVWGIYKSINDKNWIAAIVIISTVIFLSFLSFSIKYKIDKENLKIGNRYNIDIKTIYKISETYNIISAPAASIDRLEIMYKKGDTVLVSPKDKKGFINSLLEINPGIEVKYRK